jgi:hypothetical protein
LKHLYNQDNPKIVAAIRAGTFYANFHRAMLTELSNTRNGRDPVEFAAEVFGCLNILIHSAIAKICGARDCNQNTMLLNSDVKFLREGVARMAEAVMPLYLYQPCVGAIENNFHSCLATQTTEHICNSAVNKCMQELSKK